MERRHTQSLHAAVVGDARVAVMWSWTAVAVMLIVAAATVGILLMTRLPPGARNGDSEALGASRARSGARVVSKRGRAMPEGSRTLIGGCTRPCNAAAARHPAPRRLRDWPGRGGVMIAATLSGLRRARACADVRANQNRGLFLVIRLGSASARSRRSKRLRAFGGRGDR